MNKPTVGSFDHFQWLNREIYWEANNKIYPSRSELITKVACYTARLREKGIHAGNRPVIIHNAVMAFSWLMAFANQVGITGIHWHMYERFARCPYCTKYPCGCVKGPKPQRKIFARDDTSSVLVCAFQDHLAGLYPKNTLERSGLHLMSETAELQEAWMTHRRFNNQTSWLHVLEEFCDIIAHLCAVAHCATFNLSGFMVHTFKNGCPGPCRQPKCVCGYTETADSMVVKG